MKLKLKSKQYYGTHEEEIEELFDCKLEKLENSIKINFENGYIEIQDEKIIHERGENKLIIEKDNVYEVDYETSNGLIVLDLKGIEVINNISEEIEGLIASAKYQISMVGVEPYINEIFIYLEDI